jgi:hypothetical protein
MRFSPSISTLVFDELLTTLEIIGVDETIKTLKAAKSKSLILEDFDVDFVIKSIAEITGVLSDRILFGIDRSDERKMALALSIYFVKNECKYTYQDLKKIFSKDESALWRYYNMVDNLPEKPKTDFDKKLSTYTKKMNLLITQRKIKKEK